MESSSFPGSSKRAKAPGNITQVAHCLVDGCNADLSLCRDYHRRHKVCEIHSKTAKVTIGGREQRFCQQCSRFHSLVEFDEGKRSCRKRLDGHNRRRRKPQPDRNNSALDFSNQQLPSVTGTSTLLSFSSPQILPSAVVGFSWPGIVKPENEMVVPYNHHQQLNYIDHRSNSFPKRPSHHDSYNGANANQIRLLDPNAAQGSSSSNNSNQKMKMFSDGLNQVNIDSDRALSLLSSGPTPMVHDLHYGGLGQFHHHHHHHQLEQESKGVVCCSDAVVDQSRGGNNASNSTMHFSGMFEEGAEGSSGSGSHQTLTFIWE